MRPRLSTAVVLAVAAAALAGCALAPLDRADVDGRVVCNTDYMDQVERQARSRHAEIRWVHCPRATLRVI